MTPEEVIKRCDENTIGVVPTLSVTFPCQYELVKAVSDALDQLEKDTGLDIPIHVDGASGGFVAPFVEPELLGIIFGIPCKSRQPAGLPPVCRRPGKSNYFRPSFRHPSIRLRNSS